MSKLIFGLFLIAGLAYGQDDVLQPQPVDNVDINPPKEIVWDKFEMLTNTAGLAIGGKTIDKDGVITTVSVKADHVVSIKDGKTTITGHNGAHQAEVPEGKFKQVAIGYSHCVGLTEEGKVICWGYAAHGQCEVPVNIGVVTMVAAGHSHSMALDDKGQVWVWGDNHNHQCDMLDDLPVVVKIDATDDTCIAVDSEGNVYQWGGSAQPTKYLKE